MLSRFLKSLIIVLFFTHPFYNIKPIECKVSLLMFYVTGANMYNTYNAPNQFQPQLQPQQQFAQTPFMMPQQATNFPGIPAGYTDIISNPLVSNVMKEYGKNIIESAGGQMLGQVGGLKYYFAVDTRYVMKKLKLILFPFLHKVRKNNYSLLLEC